MRWSWPYPNRKILVVGEAPPPGRHYHRMGRYHLRLAYRLVSRAAGVPPYQFSWVVEGVKRDQRAASAFPRYACQRNLLDEWPGYFGRGSAFPPARARAVAREFVQSNLGRARLIVLCGRRLAEAFGVDVDCVGYFAQVKGALPLPTFVVPHPSGVNRWWNSPGKRARALRFFATTAQRAELGLT